MENSLKEILKEFRIENNKIVDLAISKLTNNAKVNELSKTIGELKSQIIGIFNMYKEKEEFKEKHFVVPNANAKKDYNFTFDMSDFPSLKIKEVKNLDTVGLQFDAENARIFGIPTVANTIDIQIVFFSIDDENLTEDIKVIPFIVNADPKDLWMNKPSDKEGRFPKEDNVTFVDTFLDKKIVIASKRGRSHAHEGTFRDDDFLMKSLPNDWAIIAVSDGAGSSQFARIGSKIACEKLVESFNNENLLNDLSEEVTHYFTNDSEEEKLKNKTTIINTLYRNIKQLHEALLKFADSEGFSLKDIHSTLIFTLVKKFSFGYVILSFGVGDCPINVIGKDNESVKLLNFLDVGEFGGGTRFITMPEIFGKPDVMAKRFGLNVFSDFSKLVLMTDGIYDPKFVVESKLENMESWKNFLRDLDGENEDGIKVDFDNQATIEEQLSHWMDFWSKGNHDDRTLAIIY